MNRRLAFAVLAPVIAALSVWAVDCGDGLTDEQRWDKSDLVVVGTIDQLDKLGRQPIDTSEASENNYTAEACRIRLTVRKSLKGESQQVVSFVAYEGFVELGADRRCGPAPLRKGVKVRAYLQNGPNGLRLVGRFGGLVAT